MTSINNNYAIVLLNFYKIIKDLIVDLNTSFGDKISVKIVNNNDYQNIINYRLPNYSDDVNIDEYVSTIDLNSISSDFFDSLDIIYNYCKGTFALRSIDILYQNEDIFLNKNNNKTNYGLEDEDVIINTVFLPDIDFADLYYADTSSKTKQTLWKYLQVILFNIITSIDDVSFFGNSLELLKIIDSNKFSSKLETTIEELSKIFSFKNTKSNKNNEDANADEDDDAYNDEDDDNDKEEDNDKEKDDEDNHEDDDDEEDGNKEEDKNTRNKKQHHNKNTMFPDMSKLFDISINNIDGFFNEMMNDLSSNFKNKHDTHATNDYAIPDKDELFSHINKLINGKIGSLAKEIAEETTKDIDMEKIGNINDVNDVLKEFMKNPSKLMGLINNINNKISNKMKDGSLKESELLEEAASIFKNMKNIPGMDNFNDLFKSMNMEKLIPKGGKINPNAFQNMMEQNIKMSKMRERMKKKAETVNETNSSQNTKPSKPTNKTSTTSSNIKLDDLTANLSSLMAEMNNNTSFIDSILKNQAQQGGTPRANQDSSKRKENNKKKVNRKK